jgi:cytochrome c peroxidase
LGRGKFHATVESLQYSFKTPTIRNINKTAPYMHNGGYKTLQEVMGFYNKGGGKGLGLKVENQTLPEDKLNLNQKEIDQIIDFMKSLDDK